MIRNVHLITFGCQMNKLDSDLILQALEDAGHRVVDSIDEADTVLYNTCSVRDQAENRVLSAVGAVSPRKLDNPRFLIGIMGCMAQRRGGELQKRYPQIDLIIGTGQFHRIAEYLEMAEAGPVIAVDELALARDDELPEHNRVTGVQAFVAVMRGCNNYCTYCIVPYVRGREESRELTPILKEVQRMVAGGAREITLLGQSIDGYGRDLSPPLSLHRLLEEVHAIEGVLRLRFVTAHPRNITEELFHTMARLPRVCRHLHMPAQSGSNRILTAMNRRYTREEYIRLLESGRRIMPDLAFSADFIVGFPGEEEEDFAATLDLVKSAQFQNIFAFRYSPRPGTRSEEALADNVPQEVKEDRLAALLAAQQEVNRERNEALCRDRTVVSVLVEGVSKKDKSRMMGRTPQSGIVIFPAPPESVDQRALIGSEVSVRLTDCTPLTLFGKPV